jgi:Putative threonine efflux protein
MTIPEALLGFAVVAALLTVIPGLDTALVLRSSLTRSRPYAVSTALGIQFGVLVWGVAAAVGATALFAASELAYDLLTLGGAIYLVGLGIWLLVSSFRRVEPAHADVPRLEPGLWRGWLTGAVTNLLNPKVGVFYLATIPQFVPAGVSPLLMGVLLAGVHVVLGMTWFAGIILGGGALGSRLGRPGFVRWIDRVTGGVLIGFGVKLALDARV